MYIWLENETYCTRYHCFIPLSGYVILFIEKNVMCVKILNKYEDMLER